MIISQLTGGIGNQMFQYAFGRSLALKFNSTLHLDISSYEWDKLRKYELNAFSINANIANHELIESVKNGKPNFKTRLTHKFINRSIPSHFLPHYKEQQFAFNETSLNIPKGDVYLEGYWQSEKYFNSYRSVLLDDFTLNKTIGENTNRFKQLILNTLLPVSVHVRRGDYAQNPETTAYHGLCGLDYYKSAMNQIQSELSTPIFYVFSDDKEYVKKSFAEFENCVYIDQIELDIEELYLMSICDHNIIANSSFSWWGAWLNTHESKIVFAPKKWFQKEEMQVQTKDLIPQSWRRI